MKHIGIIAEYNPFHNGHLYQLQQLAEHFPDKKIIVIMSGNYVQRGEPAIFSKHLRSEIALACGVDIVMELPSLYASSSSEHFATASVKALSDTGVIDTLCFGAECDDVHALNDIAEILVNETDEYKYHIKKYLSEGLSYPAARSKAVKACFPDYDYDDILRHPNNILAIEYIKAIKRLNADITPYIIKRSGASYNDLNIESDICSASALRKHIKDNSTDKFSYSSIRPQIPAIAYDILNSSPYAKPIFTDDMYPFIQYCLIKNSNDLDKYYEMTEYLSNRINSFNDYNMSYDELVDRLSGKNITKSRIRRCLLNIVLDRSYSTVDPIIRNHSIQYLRLLGFSEDSSYLIKEIQHNLAYPLINKVANAHKKLDGTSFAQFNKEIFANDIYRQAYYNKYGKALPNEYEQSVIIYR